MIRELLWKLRCRLNIHGRVNQAGPFVLRTRAEVLAEPANAHPAPRLCIVITTHRRAEACSRVVQALHAAMPQAVRDEAIVVVLNDRSELDYTPVLRALTSCFPGKFRFYDSTRWLGKHEFWRTYQHAFDIVSEVRPKHTLFLQDDLVLAPDFVQRTLEQWDAITDPTKAVLYLCAMSDDETEGRWIKYRRQSLGQGHPHKTQWFDLSAFLVDELFFRVLRYQVYPVPLARWQRKAELSSGVGEQFTRRLWSRGNIYQVESTLVTHGHEASVMNEEARRKRPLDNRARLT